MRIAKRLDPPDVSTTLEGCSELLQGFRAGNSVALEKVYWTYVDEVVRVVRRGFVYDRDKVLVVPSVADEATQCDLVQETFIRAFSATARRNYDGLSPFRCYLLRIVKNLMLDRWRKSGREVMSEDAVTGTGMGVGQIDSIIDNNLAFEPEDPAELTHRTRQQAVVAEYVSLLTEKEREFYDLRYREGMAQVKVADRMGITRRRVRTLERRLVEGLKKYLIEKGLWP